MHNFESCHTSPYRGEDGEEHHCCLSVLDTPLENCDNVLFVDGSASKDPQTGLNKVGFTVTTEFEVVKSGKLPSNYSAQAAELVCSDRGV